MESGEPEAVLTLVFEHGQPPIADRALFRWNGRYKLQLDAVGQQWLMRSAFDGAFLIDEAQRSIRVFVDNRDDPAWLDVFVRRVLPRIAILFGATAIHSAAAAIGGRGLMLLGESGAGKSTTSAALGAAGWDVLSDDISIVWHPDAPKVAPATTGMCVWPDSRLALGLDVTRCVAMPGYPGKMRFVPGNEINTALVPLDALVFLERGEGDAPVISAISGAEAMTRASHQRIRFNPDDPAGEEMQATFAALWKIASVTPCYRLSTPRDYGALPSVVDLLRATLER